MKIKIGVTKDAPTGHYLDKEQWSSVQDEHLLPREGHRRMGQAFGGTLSCPNTDDENTKKGQIYRKIAQISR